MDDVPLSQVKETIVEAMQPVPQERSHPRTEEQIAPDTAQGLCVAYGAASRMLAKRPKWNTDVVKLRTAHFGQL